jgi:uridine kinase
MRLHSAEDLIRDIQRRLAGRDSPFVVAIDGRSGSGKSTLAATIAPGLGAAIIQGDLFYSGGTDVEWKARSPAERVNLVIDWRRLHAEVLEPLLAGKPALFHPFDFESGTGLCDCAITIPPSDVVIVDGAYSSRPELADLLDLTIFVESQSDTVRRQRLTLREDAAFLATWHSIWDDAEDHYFTNIRPLSSFDLVFAG